MADSFQHPILRRVDFGPTLRRERERRGVTLQAIAQKTKIRGSLFAALERNDVSRWPGGLFRRAFVRAYAEAIGLDPEAVVERFVHFFPEADDTAPAPAAAAPPPSVPGRAGVPRLRLTLAETTTGPDRVLTGVRRRLPAALLDAVVAGGGGLTLVWLAGGWMSGALPALAVLLYFVAGAVLTGSTPGLWFVGRMTAPRRKVTSLRLDPRGQPDPASAPLPLGSADHRLTPQHESRAKA